jgi:hypothetical protein
VAVVAVVIVWNESSNEFRVNDQSEGKSKVAVQGYVVIGSAWRLMTQPHEQLGTTEQLTLTIQRSGPPVEILLPTQNTAQSHVYFFLQNIKPFPQTCRPSSVQTPEKQSRL